MSKPHKPKKGDSINVNGTDFVVVDFFHSGDQEHVILQGASVLSLILDNDGAPVIPEVK